MTMSKTIDTYEDGVDAAKNNYRNTVIELDETDLVSTNFGYAVQNFNNGTILDSKQIYSYYLFRFDDKFVLLKADPDYLSSYFDKKKANGDKQTRVYITEFDRADAGTFDSIYTPTNLIYPYDGRETVDIDDEDDFFTSRHKQYEKFNSDIPLYELSDGFVVTIKEYDLDKQKTLFLGLVVFGLLTLNAVISVVLHPKKVNDTENKEKDNKKKNK